MSSISEGRDDAFCFVLLKDEFKKKKKDEFSKNVVLLLDFLFFETL